MPLHAGTATPSTYRAGAAAVSALYAGTVKVWPTAKAPAMLVFPGVAGNYLSTPNAAPLGLTGDVELVIRLTQPDWNAAPAASFYHVVKGAAYQLFRSSAAARQWGWQHVNAAGVTIDCRVNSTVTTLAPGQMIWMRYRMDVDNGAGGRTLTVDYALDQPTEPTAWTTWGPAVTQAGVTDIRTQTTPLTLGALNNGTSPMAGRIGRVILRNGFAGPTVLDINEDDADANVTTGFTATTGQAVTAVTTAGNTIIQPRVP